MPKQSGLSEFLKRIGQEGYDAFEEHKNDEVEMSNFGELPAGIENGVAQLFSCKIDRFKTGDMKGEFYFMAQGTVHRPVTMDGYGKVEGKFTKIGPEPICNTPSRTRKTVSDHLQWIIQEVKKLGLDTGAITIAELETAIEVLVEEKPFFRFRTWKGQKQTTGPYAGREPKVQHTWEGVIDFVQGEDAEPAMEDESQVADKPVKSNQKPQRSNGAVATTQQTTTQTSTSDGVEPFSEFSELETLIHSANDGDEEAIETLTKMALEIGATQKEVEMAKSWQEVGERIKKGGTVTKTATKTKSKKVKVEEPETYQTETEEEEAPSEEEEAPSRNTVPEIGSPCHYSPVDPKTKRRVKKPMEFQVTSVDMSGHTVNLKSLDNPKVTFNQVSWDELIWDSET